MHLPPLSTLYSLLSALPCSTFTCFPWEKANQSRVKEPSEGNPQPAYFCCCSFCLLLCNSSVNIAVAACQVGQLQFAGGRGRGQGGRQPSSVAVTTSVSRMNSLPVRLAKYAAAVGSLSLSFSMSFFYLPLPLPLATFISYDNSDSSKSLAWYLKYLCGQTGDVNACWLRLVRCLFPTSFPLSLSLA